MIAEFITSIDDYNYPEKLVRFAKCKLPITTCSEKIVCKMDKIKKNDMLEHQSIWNLR